MNDEKKPMRSSIDLDWVTFTCPCGATFCTRHASDTQIDEWLAEHKPHTDGKLREHTTADGNRAYAQPEPDRTVDYP